jgi:16S rRNA (cytosine967-C5)-methyltransferase
MSRYHSYLNSAVTILSTYKGEEPCLSGRQAFSSFVKKYFSQHKKFGSKDRKEVSHLCYCFFRLGKALTDVPVEERIIIALFLCADVANEILQELKPEWNESAGLSFSAKQKLIAHPFSITDIFPWQNELSDGIDATAFSLSHLQQPDLFLRLRPAKEEVVLQKLINGGIEFKKLTDSCIALPNTSKVDELITLNEEAVVQDYSSQRVGELMRLVNSELVTTELVRRRPSDQFCIWDCCAASGGKSIMAKDILGNVDLTVSDIRESILVNLKKRFAEAGIRNYKSAIVDLSEPTSNFKPQTFNLIIADVPCSGSGTWGRTPEQLYYFNSEKTEGYTSLQKKIATNALQYLEPGGYFLYITCSVFKKENEDVVNGLLNDPALELIKMKTIIGYDKKADTMFAALLKKTL